MIYSKYLQQYIPITVTKSTEKHNEKVHTTYCVKDGELKIGQIDITDTTKGIYVDFVENYEPNLYSGFNRVANQIEVEHCLNRDLPQFQINADASLNSHALHYKAGLRFSPIENPQKLKLLKEKYQCIDVNEIVKNIINETKQGEKYMTKALGAIPMFMPKSLIDKYIKLSKTNPLIRGL